MSTLAINLISTRENLHAQYVYCIIQSKHHPDKDVQLSFCTIYIQYT